ncbi:unnamed protein product [Periconia digitata]|uniref:Zn(2)-C6 fungal-type domain-containing protein n=1 Tax=Periconia digitata TaxID=1303443 RepID=A0A9W4U946_9PLEO|nr:unnamed protein product [Periconia digitata]
MSTPDRRDASSTLEESPDRAVHSDSDDTDEEDEEEDMAAEEKSEPASRPNSPSSKKRGIKSDAPSNAKDPTRPRRKKARRACLACQRAHLTCGDERPCSRCVTRGLGEQCVDGHRKKAKYLHDAPDHALEPGVNGHYPAMPPPPHGHGVVPVPHQNYYGPAPPASYYQSNPISGPPALAPENSFADASLPMSPSYNQGQAPGVSAPVTASQASQPQLYQFGLPFDPSDPAFFNFDLQSLNFGNTYGALELGMLGHMSSGALETPSNEAPLNRPPGMYSHQIPTAPYSDQGVSAQTSYDNSPVDWQTAHSRHGSMQVHTPNTPGAVNMDHNSLRHDSLNGPHAYAIGQGPSSLASASPASTDVHSGHDTNDNPLTSANYFASVNQQRARNSPIHGQVQLGNRHMAGSVQPPQPNLSLRQREFNYDLVTQPHDYPRAYHQLIRILERRFSPASLQKAKRALAIFRPVLMSNASDLSGRDLVHAEKNLQRSLVTMHSAVTEVGTPCLICRRTGEIVGMNKEFEILTGWRREVLLGHEPNLNANFGPRIDRSKDGSGEDAVNTTPVMPGQQPDDGPHAVNLVELLDEAAAVQYLEDFADMAYDDTFGKGHRRVNMLRYTPKENLGRLVDRQSTDNQNVNNGTKVKTENPSAYQGEASMRRTLGATGIIDVMIMWHIKRDNFDMPMLVSMQIMPMLKA